MTLIFVILLLLYGTGHTEMRKYNTSTEKIFTVTKFLGLYGDISKENEYKPQFRLRMKVVIPFSSDIKSINKKDEINLNIVSQWKVATTRTKKIQLNLRNLSIQEAWNYRVLLASYNGSTDPQKSVYLCYIMYFMLSFYIEKIINKIPKKTDTKILA
eukprot:810233_1